MASLSDDEIEMMLGQLRVEIETGKSYDVCPVPVQLVFDFPDDFYVTSLAIDYSRPRNHKHKLICKKKVKKT